MFKIDGPGATVDNKFTAGDPGLNIPATSVTAPWLNAVQGEFVNVVETAGLTLDKTNNTQLRQAIEGLLSGASGQHNEAINGGFRLWQRGTSTAHTSAAYGPADRFRVDPGTGGSPSATVSRQSHTVGQTDVPRGGQYFLQFNQSAAATTTNPSLEQRMEGVEEWQGDVLTYSVWLRVTSGTLTVTPKLLQNFGGGGSATVTTTGTAFSVTTTWQKFRMTVTVPGTSGKTIGSFPVFTSFLLEFPQSTTFTLQADLWDVKRNSVPGPYFHRPLGVELALAQRYYAKSYDLDTAPGTVTDVGSLVTHEDSGTGLEGFQGMLSTIMAGGQTVTWYSAGTGASAQIEYPDGVDKAVTGTLGLGQKMHGYPTVASPPAGENVARGHFVIDKELE